MIKPSCNQNCSSISELQDYRYKDYRPNCLSYEQCDKFISSNKEKCINDCPSESEYFDNRTGIVSQLCLKSCDEYISNDQTTCLDSC